MASNLKSVINESDSNPSIEQMMAVVASYQPSRPQTIHTLYHDFHVFGVPRTAIRAVQGYIVGTMFSFSHHQQHLIWIHLIQHAVSINRAAIRYNIEIMSPFIISEWRHKAYSYFLFYICLLWLIKALIFYVTSSTSMRCLHLAVTVTN